MLLFTSVVLLVCFVGVKNVINKKKALWSNNISTTYKEQKGSSNNNIKEKENIVATNNNTSNETKSNDANAKDNNDVNANKDSNINNKDVNNSSSNKGIVMTVDQIWSKRDNKKIAFLTFDDGPSSHTPKILDILDKYKIKATFFVLGTSAKNYPEYLKREVELGHSIGNHTYSHKISYFGNYTPNAFVEDVKRCDNSIKEVLGQDFKTNLVRFPGGSFNHKSYETALLNSGFKHIDWNVENGDAKRLNVPKEELINNVKSQIGQHKHVVILMHDSSTKETTVQALPDIIEFLKSQGFEFGIISQNN